MIPRPIALGMTLCDYVIVEKGTEKVSLIGQFHRFRFERLPGPAACINFFPEADRF